MACKYYYKGHVFQNEYQLDDFLLEKAPFEPTMGDLVFSMSTAQLNISQQLSTIAKDSHEAQKKYKELLNSSKAIYNEDGDITVEDPPYIGVNKFLSGLKNESGELLFPEFRKEEYWSRRYSKWKIGEFTEQEIEEFELDQNNLPKITDETEHKKLREQMENKWKIQAKSGTAIHSVLQICFQKQKGIYNFTLNDNELKQLIDQSIKDKQYLNDVVIQQAIDYARKLNSDLVYKFGENLAFYPEFMITQDTNVIHDGKPTTLMGIIDLLIVDNTGKIHILDYKTSIHDYGDFSQAKKNAYSYQLATYQRMLQKYGLNTYEGDMLVAPIQMLNFRKEGDTYTYDGIISPKSFISINISLNSNKMWDNIDEFMPAPFKLSITTEKAMQTTSEIMSEWFPYFGSMREITRENVIKRLKKYKALEPDENGKYIWRRYKKEPIIATSESEFIDKVFKYEQSLPAYRLRSTGETKAAIKQAMKNGIQNTDFPSPIITPTEGSITWLQDTLSPYCNGSWKVEDNELLESFGIITLKTKDGVLPEQIDFIRVSTNYLYDNYRSKLDSDNPLKSRTLLTGTYEPDVVQQSKSGSMMAKATTGNIELMETMLLINQMDGMEGRTIGNIQIVNPVYANGISLNNEQLMYCWNELNRHKSVAVNKISNGTIKFATRYEQARQLFNHLMFEGEEKDWKDGYQIIGQLRGCRSVLDENINASSEDKIRALRNLLNKLNSASTKKNGVNLLDKIYSTQNELNSKEIALHNAILFAIAQLKGFKFTQQLTDHDKFIESLEIWKHGVSGTYTDNPGNANSETLNLVTTLVTEAYQNVRDEIQREKVKINELVNKLKEEAQFGALKENTVGNQVNLYSNMVENTADGDFLFKNPDRLKGAQKKFLEFALYKINKNRFPKLTDEELQEMQNNNNIEYYRVPLARGGQDSVASTRSLLQALRSKLRQFTPQNAFKNAREKLEGIFNSDEEVRDQQRSQLLFKMTNMFDGGEVASKRIDKIKEIGIENLEHNLETLLYKHLFAYSVKNNIDGVFPMIKAAMIHISTQGAIQNNKFDKDISYLTNYIRNKIFNQSIIDPKLQGLANKLGLIKQAASTFTLAFSPVQFVYQSLQGLWIDISLMIRKPDGTDAFTFNHFKKALKLVYSDLSHYSNKPTLCQLFNELYGLNDMDMNTYTERISQAKRGIWNFGNFMFKFASRPDFYNRMSIFISQMLGDGCLDAHHISDKGELIYDWKLDKRFSKFAANPTLKTSDPEYNKQKSLYYIVAKQFVNEHAKTINEKGEVVDFELNMEKPMALPRAYTNKQAESIKSLSDDIYGYYSHEKKSLIMSTTLGSMWLQFKTYWSGKKNQYLQPGGVRLRGKWEQVEREGKKYYYQVDSKGNVQYDEPLTTQETVAPAIQWKGQWQEGIILTLADIVRNSYNAGLFDRGLHLSAFKEGWNQKWNNSDENLQLAYRNNIKQFGYDLMMFLIGGCIVGALLGDWLDELKKDNIKNKDFVTGLGIAAANIAVMSVKNSFMDFNAVESIGGAITQWTPFSFEWGARISKNIWNVAMGDEDFWDGVVKTSGGLKQIKPVLDSIKPDMFRTKREGGTFG